MKEVNKTWHWMVEHPSDWLYDKYCDRIRDHLMLEYKMHRLAADTCAVSLLERTLRELRYDELHKNYVDNLDTNAHKHSH